jgi:hypothetical protein
MAAYLPQARTEIARLRKSLDDLFERADKQDDLEVQADMAKYCCLRLTGFLEQSLLIIGIELIRQKSSGRPQDFALSFLDKSFNPSPGAILTYVNRFSSTWKEEVDSLLKQDERATELAALVGTRNLIAHGKNQGIGMKRVREHRTNVDDLIDHLLDLFHPNL